uniref:Uncharacterized protein n=1 Tax=Meloidogyne enterolobii TaxID=390850 RepID=A0A6V7UDC6_MELEN|nr:unnamed protein product [Meloidogyne enterolobii]
MPPPLNNKQLKKVLSYQGRLSYNKTASRCSVGRTTVFNYWKKYCSKCHVLFRTVAAFSRHVCVQDTHVETLSIGSTL